MIGICPHCKIKLKEPPFNNRETNEVMLVMNYRKMKDTATKIKSLEDLGYCEICKARPKDIEKQKEITKS